MGRNRLRFILMKGFLYKMMKKNKKLTIRRLCFIFKASKTLKVKILHKVHNTKKFEKIAEINNETVKKNTTAQLHQKSCEKIRRMQHHGAFLFAGLLSVWYDPILCSKSET